MSGVASSALQTDVVDMIAWLLQFVGSVAWLVGPPAAVASLRPFRIVSPWIDRALLVSMAGAAVALVGGLLNGTWWLSAAAIVAIVSSQFVREQLPNRPELRGLQRSLSGMLARIGWWLSRDRQAFAAAVVAVERPGTTRRYSLTQIREELAAPVLADAERDELLRQILDALADEIAATVQGVGRVKAKPGTARYLLVRYAKVSDFADLVIALATEPDAYRTVRPYREYSATALKLAAACRLVDRDVHAQMRHRLLCRGRSAIAGKADPRSGGFDSDGFRLVADRASVAAGGTRNVGPNHQSDPTVPVTT